MAIASFPQPPPPYPIVQALLSGVVYPQALSPNRRSPYDSSVSFHLVFWPAGRLPAKLQKHTLGLLSIAKFGGTVESMFCTRTSAVEKVVRESNHTTRTPKPNTEPTTTTSTPPPCFPMPTLKVFYAFLAALFLLFGFVLNRCVRYPVGFGRPRGFRDCGR